MKTFFDAYYGPKNKYSYWVGVMIMVRSFSVHWQQTFD